MRTNNLSFKDNEYRVSAASLHVDMFSRSRFIFSHVRCYSCKAGSNSKEWDAMRNHSGQEAGSDKSSDRGERELLKLKQEIKDKFNILKPMIISHIDAGK